MGLAPANQKSAEKKGLVGKSVRSSTTVCTFGVETWTVLNAKNGSNRNGQFFPPEQNEIGCLGARGVDLQSMSSLIHGEGNLDCTTLGTAGETTELQTPFRSHREDLPQLKNKCEKEAASQTQTAAALSPP
jgi:hypothetical protein